MKELAGKPIMSKKKMGQQTLAQYNVLELLNNMGYVEMTMFLEKYNDNLVREFYANSTDDFAKIESLTFGKVYVRGHIIDFSPTHIVNFLNCPHCTNIEGTGLAEDVDFDEVAEVLTGDE